jgi:hypothetical protein
MWEKIKFLASSMWEFLKPFIKIFLTDFGPVLAAAAMAAVVATESNLTGATGIDKRNAAYAQIVKELELKGIVLGTQVTVSMINAAIEAAVQRLNK